MSSQFPLEQLDEFHWYTCQQDDILVSLGLQEVLEHSHPISYQKANKVAHIHLDVDNILRLYPFVYVSLLAAP